MTLKLDFAMLGKSESLLANFICICISLLLEGNIQTYVTRFPFLGLDPKQIHKTT